MKQKRAPEVETASKKKSPLRGVQKYCSCNIRKATRCVEDPIRRKLKTVVQSPQNKVRKLDLCSEEAILNLQNTKIYGTSQNKLKRLAGKTRKKKNEGAYKAAARAIMDMDVKVKIDDVKRVLSKKLISDEANRIKKDKSNTLTACGTVYPTTSRVDRKTAKGKLNLNGELNIKTDQGKPKAVKSNHLKSVVRTDPKLNTILSRDNIIKNQLPPIRVMLNAVVKTARKECVKLLSFYKIKQFFFKEYGLNKEQVSQNKDSIRTCLKQLEENGEIIRLTGRGLVGSFTFYKKPRRPRRANAQRKNYIE
ncbi:uncharacterized protein LOC119672783 [Teleopsis dalmanni]|uniref:uncharacterized protein LOC119672783 n=1 Tax=Teleopsis dalmanni TaxID=139649 RepID=UPI0018CF434E|nr:uncharacterized protein LOC119672783 [Teleopsis dalmanni]